MAEKVKYTARKAISESSEGLANAAKAGASFASNVIKKDPSHRYDALIKLKQLLDSDAITVDEFEVEKRKLLDA